jgi:hypothetical protein
MPGATARCYIYQTDGAFAVCELLPARPPQVRVVVLPAGNRSTQALPAVLNDAVDGRRGQQLEARLLDVGLSASSLSTSTGRQKDAAGPATGLTNAADPLDGRREES